ncbi:MAG TPA: hypothetical protein VF638_14430 [Sphingomonas sp.]|jgi:hypothetical protein
MTIEIKFYAETLVDLAGQLDAFRNSFTADNAPAGNAETKPATRGRKSKDAGEPAASQASEPSSPSVAIEPTKEVQDAVIDTGGPVGNAGAVTTVTEAAGTTAPESAALTEPTIDRDTVMTAAVKLSQIDGGKKLQAALAEMGAAKFSDIPAEKYATFLDVIEKHSAPVDALS